MNSQPECALFLERLNAVLDGEAARETLLNNEHVLVCANCRKSLTLAESLAAWKPNVTVPAGFADRAVAAALKVEHRRHQRTVAASLMALAAAVVIGIFALRPASVKVDEPKPLASVTMGVNQPLNDAREAIASLSAHAVDESIKPAAKLLTIPSEKPKVSSAAPLAELPVAAKAGVQPIVNSPVRAFNLFVRDANSVAGGRKAN